MMPTVQVQSEVLLEELLHSIEQLDSRTLERFADEVMLIRANRRAPSLPKAEATLLRQINQGLSDEVQARFDELKAKRQAELLTVTEHEELIVLVEQIEQRDVERLEALTKLAQLRGVSVRTLMQQLGLRSGANE